MGSWKSNEKDMNDNKNDAISTGELTTPCWKVV